MPFKCFLNYLSNVTFQMSPFKCHLSNVTFQMPPFKCQQPLNVNRISILTLLFFICDFFKAKVPLTRLSDTTFWPRHDYRVRSKAQLLDTRSMTVVLPLSVVTLLMSTVRNLLLAYRRAHHQCRHDGCLAPVGGDSVDVCSEQLSAGLPLSKPSVPT